jgi:hypothetical protein
MTQADPQLIAKTPLVLGMGNVGYIIDENGQRVPKSGAIYAIQKGTVLFVRCVKKPLKGLSKTNCA